MITGPSLLAIGVFAAFLAMPLAVVVSAGALAAPRRRRRYVLLGTAVAALLGAGAAVLLLLDIVRMVGVALLAVGLVAASAASAMILLRKAGTAAAGVVGLIGAVLVGAGHLMYSAPALAAAGASAMPDCVGPQRGSALAVLISGLGGGAITLLVVATGLLLLHRLFEPFRGGIALGTLAAVLATGTQLLLGSVGTQVPTLTVTVLGLVLGTLIGAMRSDRSGALAGMPPGNH